MSLRRRPWGAAAAALVPAALIIALVSPTGAFAAPAAHTDNYPTWQDVQNAKRSQAATAAQIDEIEGLLVSLEATSARLGKVAQLKAEEYAEARDALAAATQKVDRLTALAADARTRADESTARAARVIAQLARTGGGDLTLGLITASTTSSASQTDQLLARLSTMSRLTESSADILARAQFDQNLAASLGDDAKVAASAREGIAADAQVALDAAQAASDEAESQVAEQTKNADRMYEQLAALKHTTAAIEKKYQEGLDQKDDDPPSDPSGPSNPSNPPNPSSDPTTPSTPPGVDPTPDPPVASAVSKAISYAKAQLGEPYKFAGAGPSSWDCSGLTKMSYAAAGVYIGTHSVSNQYATMKSQGRLVKVGERKAGDLLFYSYGGSSSGGFYHVTMYIGNGQMIEAPRPGVNVRIVTVRTGDLVGYAGRPTG